MKPPLRWFATAAVTAASAALLLVAVPMAVRSFVIGILTRFDPEVSVVSIVPSPDALLLTGLVMPSRGMSADSAWILLDGAPFRTVPVQVVLSGATVVTGEGFRGRESGDDARRDMPPLSVLEGTLVAAGTESRLFAARRAGGTLFQVSGSWGCVWGESRADDGVTLVFRDCTGFPGLPGIPGASPGSYFCGVARGTSRDGETMLSGRVTGFNGSEVDIPFRVDMARGDSGPRLSLDLSGMAAQLSEHLYRISGGTARAVDPRGTLTLASSGGDTLDFSFSIGVREMELANPSIAPDTVRIRCAGTGCGTLVPGDGVLRIDSGTVAIGEAWCRYELLGRWGAGRTLLVRVHNDSLSGEALCSSVPGPVLGRLAGLRLSGNLSFDITLFLDWNRPDSCDISVEVDPSALRVEYCPVAFGPLAHPSGATALMRDSWGNSRRIGLDSLASGGFASLGSFPPWLEPLLCAAEDGTFRSHHGFSEFHLRNSIRANMARSSFVRGGSTLTMQLVKNLFLGREKTLARKLQEVFLTWRMESNLSKDRILELYVNVVEMGPDVFGFGEAARYYFGSSPGELTVRETAFLVSILPGPRLYHRFAVSGRVPDYWERYLDRLIRAAENRAGLSSGEAASGLSETLVFDGRVSGD
jgi:hypothetical protein